MTGESYKSPLLYHTPGMYTRIRARARARTHTYTRVGYGGSITFSDKHRPRAGVGLEPYYVRKYNESLSLARARARYKLMPCRAYTYVCTFVLWPARARARAHTRNGEIRSPPLSSLDQTVMSR